MPTQDRRIDSYIARAQPFAKPILRHLRALIHKAVPGVEETIKWGMPHFIAHGAILCSMASFKQHCAFVFWKGNQIPDRHRIFGRGEKAMGQLGRIGSVADLPPARVLTSYLRTADALNKAGTPGPRATSGSRKPPGKAARTPADFSRALVRHPRAKSVWEAFSPSQRKDYVEWITEAKRAETRTKRLATAILWISAGKARNWRYMKLKRSSPSSNK